MAVDFRGLRLSYLVSFREKLLSETLAADVTLCVSTDDFESASTPGFYTQQGETVMVESGAALDGEFTMCVKASGEVVKGEVPTSQLTVKDRSEWTLEDLSDFILFHGCEDSGTAYTNTIDKGEVSPEEFNGVFVLHSMNTNFNDFVTALERHFESKIDETYVWVDAFALQFPKVTAVQSTSEREQEAIETAIKSFKQHLVFLNSWDKPEALQDARSIWQLFLVLNETQPASDIPIEDNLVTVVLPESEEKRFCELLVESQRAVFAVVGQIEVGSFSCENIQDKERIIKCVQEEGVHERIASLIRGPIRGWMLTTGRRLLQAAEDQGDLVFAASLGVSFGDHLRDADLEDEAAVVLKKALAWREQLSEDRDNDPKVAKALASLAELNRYIRNFDGAKELAEEALEIRKRVFPNGHQDLAQSLNNLGCIYHDQSSEIETRQCYDKAFAMRKKFLPPDHADIGQSLHNLAGLARDMGNNEEALEKYSLAVEYTSKTYGQVNPYAAMALGMKAWVYLNLFKFDKAIETAKEAIALRKRMFGYYHSAVASSIYCVAVVLKDQKKYDESLKHHQESLRIRKRIKPEDDSLVLVAFSGIAWLFRAQKKYDTAQEYYEKALVSYRKAGDLQGVGAILESLGVMNRERERYKDALKYLNEAIEIHKGIFGEEHRNVSRVYNMKAIVLKKQKKWNMALALYKKALEIDTKAFGNDNRFVANNARNVASILHDMKRIEESLEYYQQCLEIRRKILKPKHHLIAASLHNLGYAFRDLRRYEEAVKVYEEALEIDRSLGGAFDGNVASDLVSLATVHHARGDYDTARGLYEEALAIRRKIFPRFHRDVVDSLRALSSVLLEQYQYMEAASLLEEAIEINKQLLGENHLRVAEDLDRLANVLDYMDPGSPDATEIGKEAYAIALKKLGPNDPLTLLYRDCWLAPLN